jgi:uncharacterized membrane protein YphA (DoxX/SURF4 family)
VDTAIWIAQVLLGILFVLAGVNHALNYARASQQMVWMTAVGPERLRVIGVLEILGGIGVLVPQLTGTLPWLVPLAAALLALLMVFAMIFHARRGERAAIVFNLVLALLAAFVAYGRLVIEPFAA